MLDLVILLSMALALTAVLAVLLAGFVWVPWLIGLLLIVLLIALSRVSMPPEQASLQFGSSQAGSPKDRTNPVTPHPESSAQGATSPEPAAASHPIEPVLTYRGAHPAPSAGVPSTHPVEPVLTYRGAKSQLHEVIPQALLAKWQGKYRGNPLKRPEG